MVELFKPFTTGKRTCLSVHQCLCFYVCLSRPPVYPSIINLFLFLSVNPLIHLSIHSTIHLSYMCLIYIFLSVCVFNIHLSVCLISHSFIYRSICLCFFQYVTCLSVRQHLFIFISASIHLTIYSLIQSFIFLVYLSMSVCPL